MSIEKIKEKLRELTGKKNIILTRRGNKALKFSLRAMKGIGKKKIIIQDQGGWITYPQYAEELKFELIEIKSDYGVINLKEMKEKTDSDSVLLINSMPGYFVYENIEEIARIANEKDAVLINDVSGSIGSEEGKTGDIIFGSTGRWKAINVHYGGFIATDMDYFNELGDAFDEKHAKLMLEKIDGLDERTEKLRKQAKKVKEDLKDFDIIHRD